MSIIARPREKHGKYNSPEYSIWKNMRHRCNNPKDKRYSSYGGRGIKVCKDWENSFKTFYEAVGSRPTAQHTLDRIEVDGDYELRNVRWATRSQQNMNKRLGVRSTSGYKGVNYRKDRKTWQVHITLADITYSLGCYKTAEEAGYIYDQVASQLFGEFAKLNFEY